jgi:hypothetical protein
VNVAADEIIGGDVVVMGGAARVDGEVRGDVVAFGGGITLGPTADVSGNVVSIGGPLNRDPAARVGGEVRVGPFGADNWWRGIWRGRSGRWPFAAPFAFVAQIARIAVLCLLAALVLLVGRQHVERVSARAATEPLKAGAIGLLAQLLFLPALIVTVVLLVVTIVGIPLLVLIPFAILALVLVAIVGFTAVAFHVGRLATARLSWTANPFVTASLGVLVLLTPVLLARLVALGGTMLTPVSIALVAAGWIVEYLAWTVGFGAVVLTRFAKSV